MRQTIVWTRVDDNRLVRWTKECVPVAEIAAALGKSYSDVVTRRQKLKHEGRIKRLGYKGHREWTHDEELELVTLWAEGKSYKFLANRYGRSETSVKLKLKRMGVKRRRDREWLTSRDIQALMGLGCSKAVPLWVTLGWLKPLRAGRKRRDMWRFAEDALWAFVEIPEAFVAYDPARITDPDLQAHALEHRAKYPKWMSIGDVARRFHVGHGAVNDWVNSGLFPLDALVKYPNWWIREDVLVHFVPPIDRPKARAPRTPHGTPMRITYLCCNRAAPLDLIFAVDREERICDECRKEYRVYHLSNGQTMRIYPLRGRHAI